MTKQVKKTNAVDVSKEPVKEMTPIVNNLLIGATEPLLKGLAVYASVEMLKQPQFTMQANQAGLVELADLLYKYMTGQVTIKANVPETNTDVDGPTFG